MTRATQDKFALVKKSNTTQHKCKLPQDLDKKQIAHFLGRPKSYASKKTTTTNESKTAKITTEKSNTRQI